MVEVLEVETLTVEAVMFQEITSETIEIAVIKFIQSAEDVIVRKVIKLTESSKPKPLSEMKRLAKPPELLNPLIEMEQLGKTVSYEVIE